MNAGFSNLATLKKMLLASSLKNDTRFDAVIQALGLGVANQFENLCGRKFGYVVGDTETFPADRAEFILSRTPVTAVTAWAVKHNEQDGWVARDLACIRFINLVNGIVNPSDHDVGPWHAQVQFTFTGGYFWEQLEPDDAAFPSAAPAGAAVIPNDLFNAWSLQVRHLWRQLDKLGVDILKAGDEKSLRFPEDFAPTVENTLASYIRYKLV